MIIFNYLLVCLIFGTTFLAIKIGINASVPPFFSAGARFFLAGALLFSWSVWRKKVRFSLLLRKEMLLTGIGLTFGTFSALYFAEQYVASGLAAVLSATGPFMILLLQMLVLRQKPTLLSIVGCAIGFAGVTLLLLPSLAVSANLKWLLGCIAILIGEVFYTSGALYSKRVIQTFQNAPPIALNAAQMIYGGLLLLILSGLTEHVHMKELLTGNAIGSLLYLIIAGSMVASSLFYWLVAKTTPFFPSTWLYISPLIALMIGALFYGETVTWMTGLGAMTIIIGTIIANWDSLLPLVRKFKIQRRVKGHVQKS